jgi:hypothetical protein
LHPKFYMPIFLWDVESSPNYTEKTMEGLNVSFCDFDINVIEICEFHLLK